MTPQDIEILRQLPVVGIVLIAVFKMMKDNRKHQDHRDDMFMKQLESRDLIHSRSMEVMSKSVDANTITLRAVGEKVFAIGYALVALAGEDNKKGAAAAKQVMKDVFEHTVDGRTEAKGYGD